VAAEAGSGKTNLLVEMQQQYASRDLPTLLIRAGRMEKTSLAEQLCYLLNIDASIGLAEYTNISGTQESPTMVLIDGLNEAHNAESLWQELFEISQCFTPGSLKFVVSTRATNSAEVNRYSISSEQLSHLFGDSKDNELQVSAFIHWLTALSMEEMKEAWDFYVKKDKGKFKPLFAFDDLASFDRSLYNQLSNPLVLRLFLETYQGKGLPKKGSLHLDVWGDWLASFSEQEQHFFSTLAEAIWEKGENELLLDDVLNDERLKGYFTTDQLNAPYPRLRNLGWISRYVKDLNACVGLTVEGALLYLLGKKLRNKQPSIELTAVKSLLQSGSKIQKAGVGNFLEQLALQVDLSLVCELIDFGEEFIDVCTTPIVLHLKTSGVKETLDILLQNPTENDWLVLLKVDEVLEELTLHPLRKEMAKVALSRIDFSSKAAVQYGLKGIPLVDREEGEEYLSVIERCGIELEDDAELSNSMGKVFAHFADYGKALEFYQKCLDIWQKTIGAEHPKADMLYNDIGKVLRHKGQYDEALGFTKKSLDIRVETFGAEHHSVADSLHNIGVILTDKQEYDRALEYHYQSLNIKERTLGVDHPDVALSYNSIGVCCYENGEHDKALGFYQKCLDVRLRSLGATHSLVATSYNNIGLIYGGKGEFNKAMKCFEQSLGIWQKTNGLEHPYVALSYYNIGNICYEKGEFEKALEYFQQCLEINMKILGTGHPYVGVAYFSVGNCQKELQLYDNAIETYLKGYEIEKNDGIFPYRLGQCYESITNLNVALDYYVLSADVRSNQEGGGLEHPATQESIAAAVRIAKQIQREDELPKWMDEMKRPLGGD
jgi:tetratricopeptide (TPR) repeat protein